MTQTHLVCLISAAGIIAFAVGIIWYQHRIATSQLEYIADLNKEIKRCWANAERARLEEKQNEQT